MASPWQETPSAHTLTCNGQKRFLPRYIVRAILSNTNACMLRRLHFTLLTYSNHIRNALDLSCPLHFCLLFLTSQSINPCCMQKMRRGTMLTRVDQMSPFPEMPPGGALETPSVNDLRKRMAIFSTASWCDEGPSPVKRSVFR